MALIRCSECGRQVSEKAANCPACGAPIDKRGSLIASSAYERRIDQYKKAKYKEVKREENSITLAKANASTWVGFCIVLAVYAFVMIFNGLIWGMITLFGSLVLFGRYFKGKNQVTIMIINGKVVEKGNVLNKKS